ncbi:hypothetical protein BJX96DRAFT_173824 [Aspergillus floccosus]
MVLKPDVAVLSIGGRGNLNGRPFNGSAAQFAAMEAKWLDEPEKVIWCLLDEFLIPPFEADMRRATGLLEKETTSKVVKVG